MADLSKIAAQEIGEMSLRHFQEINAHLDKEKTLTEALIERTQWLRMLTMGEMRLEYVQVLEDGQLRYNDPSNQIAASSVEPTLPETCVQAPEDSSAAEDDESEASNGNKSAEALIHAS